MENLHEILINQLKRENINPHLVGLDEHWQRLLAIISSTYKDYDDYRYAMERSLDIASEEINKVNSKYQLETNKLNSLHKDSIIIVDAQWTIKSLNSHALEVLAEGEEFANSHLNEYFTFYNSQKRIIDFEKLKLHFECGTNYVCPKGALICGGEHKKEVMVSFCIKPIYQNNQLEEYAIIIEDIGAAFIEELENLIQFNKLNLNLSIKQEQIERNSEHFIANNHLLIMTQGLLRYNNNQEINNLQHFLINTLSSLSLNKDLSITNVQADNNGSHKGFHYDRLSGSVHEGLKNILRNPNVEIESQLGLKICEDDLIFGGFIYELTGELIKLFFTSDILKIKLHLMTTIEGMTPKIIISYQLGQEYPMSEEQVKLKLDVLKQHSINPNIDYYKCSCTANTLQLDFILNFKTKFIKEETRSNSLFPLKCLLLEKPDSHLSQLFAEYGLFDLFQCHTLTSRDNAVQLIKEARLDGDEFDVIITNFDDLEAINNEIITEVASYLTPSFIGVIFLGVEHVIDRLHNDIPIIKIANPIGLEELRTLLYSRCIERSILQYQDSNLPELSCQNQAIKLFDLNSKSMITYLHMLHYLGYKTYPQWGDKQIIQTPVDLVLINLNELTKEVFLYLTTVLKDINTPVLVCIPSLDDAFISELLTLGVSDYLVKPFTMSDLVSTINKLTRD